MFLGPLSDLLCTERYDAWMGLKKLHFEELPIRVNIHHSASRSGWHVEIHAGDWFEKRHAFELLEQGL